MVRESFIYTLLLAFLFTLLQLYEYIEAPFNISDGIYGSTFFMATGFHGFHVIIGTIFSIVCIEQACYRYPKYQKRGKYGKSLWRFLTCKEKTNNSCKYRHPNK